MTLKPRLLLSGSAVAAVVLAVTALVLTAPDDQAAEAAGNTAEAVLGDLEQSLTLDGTLEPSSTWTVTHQTEPDPAAGPVPAGNPTPTRTASQPGTTTRTGQSADVAREAGGNTPPIPADHTVVTAEDTPVSITLSGRDPDGDPITFALTRGPAHGTLTGSVPTLRYTPDRDFSGADAFTVTATDGRGGTATATVRITVTPVNDVPVAYDDHADAGAGQTVGVPVLANDTDADGDQLAITSVTDPAHGVTTVDAGNAIGYTPDAGFSGTDSFDYTVSDGHGGFATATVTIAVAEATTTPAAVRGATSAVQPPAGDTGQQSGPTVTWLPEPGTTIQPGQTLYELGGTPTVLLPGAAPAWRPLAEGMDDGTDVLQLEAFLAGAGYSPGAVDEHFTAETGDAVAAWQDYLGVEPTGELAMGSVVFASGPLVVRETHAAVGSGLAEDSQVLTVSSTTTMVEFAIDPVLAGQLAPANEITVRLTDGSSVTAAITALRPAEGGTVAVATPAEAPAVAVTPTPITVTHQVVLVEGTLIVPAEAVIQLDNGTQAVRRPDGTVASIEVVASSNGEVAISSAHVSEGDRISVP